MYFSWLWVVLLLWGLLGLLSACNVKFGGKQRAICLHLKQRSVSENIYCDLDEYGQLTFEDFNGDVARGWNFGNQNCNKETSTLLAIVRPANTFEVSQIVKIARSSDISLSMRSGGHSYTCNSLKPGSIHLDMRSLNQIQMLDNTIDDSPHDTERKVLKTGTGNTFRQLLKFTGKDDYSYVHGECHSVGVGGFYLHGGAHAGILTEKYGFGNESIRELEMVTADGSILQFTEKKQNCAPRKNHGPYQPFGG